MKKFTLLVLPLLLSACGSGVFSNPFLQTINVTLSPSQLTLTPGANAKVQVTGTVNGSTQVLTGLKISASEVPSDLSVTASTGQISVTAKNTANGDYTIPLAVTTDGGQGQGVLAVHVAPAAVTPYVVNVVPSDPSMTSGSAQHFTIQATRAGTPDSSVKLLSITGALPSALDATDPLGFTVTVPANQTAGSYTLQLKTTDGLVQQITPMTVTVTVPTPN